MSYAEPLITIALIALALIFNRPIGNALLMIGESPMLKCKRPRCIRCRSASPQLGRYPAP
jgi:hypothetical protein